LVKIAGSISPPFGEISIAEQERYIDMINESGAQIVLVSLGCPKQEIWMATHYKKINAVLLGIGGAFMVTAGLQKRSPKWMQRTSLEWFYRLIQEPRRLFIRYWMTNFLFLWLISKELYKKRVA